MSTQASHHGWGGFAGRVRQHHVAIGVTLSLLAHLGFGTAVLRVQIDGSSTVNAFASSSTSNTPLMQVDWLPERETEAPPPSENKPSPPPPAFAQAEPPPPLPVPETEPKPKPREIVLGVDGSKAKTENWLGFEDPTEHSAKKSVVEQPALDRVSGRPGMPSEASRESSPSAEVPPVLMDPSRAKPEQVEPVDSPKPPVPQPLDAPQPARPLEKQFETQVTKPAEQTPPPSASPSPTRQSEQPVIQSKPEAQPQPFSEHSPDQVKPPSPDTKAPDNLVEPGPLKEEIKAQNSPSGDPFSAAIAPNEFAPRAADLPPTPGGVAPMPRGQSDGTAGADTKTVAAQPAQAPPAAPQLLALGSKLPLMLTSENLEAILAAARRAEAAQQPASQRGAAAPPMPPGGDGAQRIAEPSEAESDASSLKDPIEVHLGRPAAADGIQIVTRRPAFTLLTRVTAAPKNPVLSVWFDRSGTVVDVQILESSGVRDVDEPVVNATYQWQGKGERFEKLASAAPDARLKIVVEIVLQ
jgi:TonB family protein